MNIPFNLDIPKIGYVLAVKKAPKGDFFGNAIEKVQLKNGFNPADACYTHVEILSGGPDSVRIAPPRTKPIDITVAHKGREVKILKYSYPLYHAYLRYKIALKYNTLSNKKYDKFGIIAFLWSAFRHDPNSYFCSEGCCETFQYYFPSFLNGILPDKCFPAHFTADPNATVHWEGTITEIKKGENHV